MKVLFISRKFPPSVGGMELFAHDYSAALQAVAEVNIVAWGGTNKYLTVAALPWLFLKSLLALLRGDVDVVHAHDGIVTFIALPLARLFGKPLVVVLHGLDITYPNPVYQATIPRMVKRADRVVCVSQATADQAIKHSVPAAKISTVPLAVQDDRYETATAQQLHEILGVAGDTPVIATVGRLVARKGVAWFIEHCLPKLVEGYPKLMYAVVGEGSDRSAIEVVIASSAMTDHVRLLGRATNQAVAAVYNGANVFVMPNINLPGDIEGFGLVVLEAALCARPIVASNTEGIADAVRDGQNGVLINVKDATGFAAAISAFLADPKTAGSAGERARHYTLQNYSWPNIVRQYVAIYESLL